MTRSSLYFWNRLDAPGSDACRLLQRRSGWTLSGGAAFWDSRPCQLRYRIALDEAWRTLSAEIDGFVGMRGIKLRIVRVPDSGWSLNGQTLRGMDACVDIDLGFSAATNQIAIRRLGLEPGEAAPALALWLEPRTLEPRPLKQTYRRRNRLEYDYEAPDLGFAARLEVDADGAVIRYPGLCERYPAGVGTAAGASS